MADYAVRPNCPLCHKPLAVSKFGGEGAYWCPNKKQCGFKGIKGKGFKKVVSTDPIPVLTSASKEQKAIFAATTTSNSHMVCEALAGTGKTTVLVQKTRIYHERGLSVAIMAFATRDKNAISGKVHDKAVVNTSSGWGLRILNAYHRKVHGGRLNVDFNNFVGGKLYEMLKTDGMIDEEGKWQCKRQVLTSTIALLEKIRATFPMSVSGKNGLPTFPTKSDIMGIALTYEIDTAEEWPIIVKYTTDMLKKLMSLEWMSKHGVDGSGMTFLPVYHHLMPADKYDRVLVDECQDQSYYTRMIAEMYREQKKGRIDAVGDKNQAIYAWRGADSRAIDEMIKLMKTSCPTVETFPLTECRRCSKTVIRLAQQIVPAIKALDNAPEGSEEHLESDEAFIADLLKEKRGMVLCRMNAPLISICLQMLAKEIPAVILRSNVVKDIITLIDNGSSGVGEECPVEKLIKYVQEWQEERIAKLSERKGTEQQIQLVQDKAACIFAMADIPGIRTSGDLKRKLDSMFEKAYDNDEKPNPTKMVVLSTVHGAKGGEAPTVYLYSPMPTEKKPGSVWDAIWTDAEDRNNLLYVAITRCENRIVHVGPPANIMAMVDEVTPDGESKEDKITAALEKAKQPKFVIEASAPVNIMDMVKPMPKMFEPTMVDKNDKAVPMPKKKIVVPQIAPPLPTKAYVKPVVEKKKPVVVKKVAPKKKISLVLNIKKLPPLKPAK